MPDHRRPPGDRRRLGRVPLSESRRTRRCWSSRYPQYVLQRPRGNRLPGPGPLPRADRCLRAPRREGQAANQTPADACRAAAPVLELGLMGYLVAGVFASYSRICFLYIQLALIWAAATRTTACQPRYRHSPACAAARPSDRERLRHVRNRRLRGLDPAPDVPKNGDAIVTGDRTTGCFRATTWPRDAPAQHHRPRGGPSANAERGRPVRSSSTGRSTTSGSCAGPWSGAPPVPTATDTETSSTCTRSAGRAGRVAARDVRLRPLGPRRGRLLLARDRLGNKPLY